MPFDLDSERELAPLPLVVAPNRDQRARWLAAADGVGLDLHRWMLDARDLAARTRQRPRLSVSHRSGL